MMAGCQAATRGCSWAGRGPQSALFHPSHISCHSPPHPRTRVDLVALVPPDELAHEAVVHLLHLRFDGREQEAESDELGLKRRSARCGVRAAREPHFPPQQNPPSLAFSKCLGAAEAIAVECSKSVMTNASWRSCFSSSSWRASASPTYGQSGEQTDDGPWSGERAEAASAGGLL